MEDTSMEGYICFGKEHIDGKFFQSKACAGELGWGPH